jgi:hypothetical protein
MATDLEGWAKEAETGTIVEGPYGPSFQ